MQNINYKLLNDALLFYSLLNYNNITSPWKIPSNIMYEVSGHNEEYIGSAEQSMFYMRYLEKLEDNTLYQSITPCFRYEDVLDDLYVHEFIKLELMIFNPINITIDKILNDAKSFFMQYSDNVKIVKENTGFDIIINDIEVGSYYKKEVLGIAYICGTGVALPRLQELGYHSVSIIKHPHGTIGKIQEEFEEYLDAIQQNNPIMALVELSDLLGALEKYSQQYNINLYDIKTMTNATKRAFKNRRK